MSVALPDVNVLIALAWPTHVHHRQAHQWFARCSSVGWATCPLTQCGFTRISSNPRIIADAVSPREALSLLRRMIGIGNHVFWPDEVNPAMDALFPLGLLVGHRQVTDAYLLALAIRREGRLATLDNGIGMLLPPRSPYQGAIEVIPTE